MSTHSENESMEKEEMEMTDIDNSHSLTESDFDVLNKDNFFDWMNEAMTSNNHDF
jgi:hypothetical protein